MGKISKSKPNADVLGGQEISAATSPGTPRGLSKDERVELVRLLQTGEEISAEWSRLLFPPEKREYELVYQGKEREEDILANTLAVPLQRVRTFGTEQNGWQNKLIFGDNLQVLKNLVSARKAGDVCSSDGTHGARLIYIDPPFATKQEFRGSQDQKAYQDKVAGARFIEFLRKRLLLLREVLAEDGFIVVHIDYRFGHYAKVIMDELLPSGFRNDIKVPRGTKNVQNQFDEITALTVGDDSLLLYGKSRASKLPHLRIDLGDQAAGKWDTFWRGTDRKTMRYKLFGKTPDRGQWRWKKTRAEAAKLNYEIYLKEFAAREALDDYYLRNLAENRELDFIRLNEDKVVQYFVPPRDSRIASTIWTDIRTIGRVTGYPTEKHEELLFRLVNWLSRPGDLVIDAFAGSGTTCAVAEKLGRRWIGVDCGKLSIYTIQKRLLSLREEIGNKGDALSPSAFALYNAGLYDFSKLKDLPWDAWRFFSLQLFQCRDQAHTVGGIKLDGYFKGSSVLVFNHKNQPGARIDEETIESMHEALGSKVGNRLFIIAPALVFDFQQDYLTIDRTRYYALRIPYSIIHELHAREFAALKQPADEMAVNDTVDAVGFDFVRRPELEYEIESRTAKGSADPQAVIKIKRFRSEAALREGTHKANRASLSMVMLDYDYDTTQDVFAFDEMFYAEDIASKNWELSFPLSAIGKQLMAVFVDIYGNEARELIPGQKFSSHKKSVVRKAKVRRAGTKK